MKTFTKIMVASFLCLFVCCLSTKYAEAAVMNDYCNVPPFVAGSVPPLVLLTTGRDHKLYYEAFNEAMDLDEDGRVDVGYMHNIDYYGYFDSYKCYTYTSDAAGFTPVTTNADKFCVAGQWSGNVLNWLTMSRMDVLRKVLYGGHRITDTTTSTVLERVYVPGDAHSWGKEITGNLCSNGSVFKNSCNNTSDCDAGYTCTDKSVNLIGMAKADNSVCPATAVTWSASTAGKILVAQFAAQAGGAANGPTHADLLNSFYTDAGNNTIAPLVLIDMAASGNPAGTSSKIKYINNFNDSAIDPAGSQAANTNFLAVTQFTTPDNNDSNGLWQFAVDGDDGVEIEILPANKLPANPANWIVANYYGAHGACFLPTATASPNNQAFCNITQTSEANGYFNLATPPVGKVCSKNLSKTCVDDTGCNLATEGRCVRGGIQMARNTKYFMIVRQTNGTSQGGVRAWYRRPKDAFNAWTIFGSATLTLSSPTIAPGNECSILNKVFVDTADTTTGESRQHLFCSTTRSVAGTPVLRLLKNRLERKWNWASKERPVCADVIRNIAGTADIALTVDGTKANVARIWDYSVRNVVCKDTTPDIRPADKQDASATGKETNCRPYKSGGTTTYKPAGLLQKYAEGDGTKVCSRTYSKTCTTDANCTNNASAVPPLFEGLCIDKAPMYFGLMTDSYVKNLSGGVLRKDIWSMSDEINMATGQFILPPAATTASYNATFPQGGIIPSFEGFRTVGFGYTNNDYTDTSATNNGGTCGWIVNNPLVEGNCRMWGNPIGEMMYEGLRYLAGKTAPTATFIDASAQDGSLPLYRQDWGLVRSGNTFRPYGDNNSSYPVFPACSKPFMLVLSDENVSYDSDSIPGSKFKATVEDAGLPQLNINVETTTDLIGSNEGIEGQTVFIGDNTTTKNFMCSSKTVSKLSLIRGLCSEEPTKEGSYYSAGVALYGKTLFKTNTGKPNVTTYSLVLSSPVPKMTIRVNGKDVILVPIGKSVSGGGVENSCSNRCTLSVNALGSLVISGCTTSASVNGSVVTAGSYCPSNQIVDFYVDTVLYDNNNAPPYTASNPAPNITYAKFRINFEDVEQGADHDMDAIATYEICTGATCSPALTNPNQLKISVSSDYAAGGINQAMGFVISGTTEDNPYLVVRDSDSAASATGLTLAWNHTFDVTSVGASTTLLKNPLWYAAKWGGFADANNNNRPDQKAEWAKECTKADVADCDPDNYYLVVNPLKLETQLNKALTDILAKVSSGTAASIVNNRGESGANVLQAVFYPSKTFGNSSASWIGEIQNLWYYLDPFLVSNTVREDTNQDRKLNITQDYYVDILFDSLLNKTVAKRFSDNGSGTYTLIDTVDPEELKSVWRAGEKLHARDLAVNPRTIYTTTNGTSLFNLSLTTGLAFSGKTDITLQSYLQAADATEAEKIVKYVNGVDFPSDTTMRSRTVTNNSITDVWKLGDIVTSTPQVQPQTPLNQFDQDYLDDSYGAFFSSRDYKNRGMVYVGANDGMLHAFKMGKIENPTNAEKLIPANKFLKGKLVGLNPDTTPSLGFGDEEWAYVPKNVLPYLRYLSPADYNHLFFVDNTTTILDVSINAPTTSTSICSAATYWLCDKKTSITTTVYPDDSYDLDLNETSWRSVLIGGMGLGGATRNKGVPCNSSSVLPNGTFGNCVNTPVNNVGYSAYFALDVTNPQNPGMMWEFPDKDKASHAPALGALGFATTGPAIVRVGQRTGAGTVADPFKPGFGKNGRWFAVFASGPTGPLDTVGHQFYGRSDQNLKIFIVDLKTGELLRTIDTTIPNAFAGSLYNSVIDTEKWDTKSPGNYSDNVLYVGFTKPKTVAGVTDWIAGGVGRLMIGDDPADVTSWKWSVVVNDIGPVTSSIAKLQDRRAKNLWLYFGTGRYYHKADDPDTIQALYGIKEPCYSTSSAADKLNTIDFSCTTSTALSKADLTDQSCCSPNVPTKGWYITLEPKTSSYMAQRMISAPRANLNGKVDFTTFKPTADICGFGGLTKPFAVKYDTGGPPPAGTLTGKVLIQLSTGSFVSVDQASAYTDRACDSSDIGCNPALDPNDTPLPPPPPPAPPVPGVVKPPTVTGTGRQVTGGFIGVPPAGASAPIMRPKGINKILHTQER